MLRRAEYFPLAFFFLVHFLGVLIACESPCRTVLSRAPLPLSPPLVVVHGCLPCPGHGLSAATRCYPSKSWRARGVIDAGCMLLVLLVVPAVDALDARVELLLGLIGWSDWSFLSRLSRGTQK